MKKTTKTFYNLPPSWDPGYAIPQYVMQEPVGRGTFTTKWLPRRTISRFPPAAMIPSSPVLAPISGFSPTGSLEGDTLGVGEYDKSKDPIGSYGQQAAKIVFDDLRRYQRAGERSAALKRILDQIDPRLNASAEAETKKLKLSGLPSGVAAERGLAIAFSKGLLKEFADLGKGKKGKRFRKRGLSGLGGVTSTVSNTVSKIGDLSCAVANNPLTPVAAGAATSAYGGGPQTGVAGTMVARQLCGGGGSGPYTPPPPTSSTPSWLLPAAIGAGALVLVVALKK